MNRNMIQKRDDFCCVCMNKNLKRSIHWFSLELYDSKMNFFLKINKTKSIDSNKNVIRFPLKNKRNMLIFWALKKPRFFSPFILSFLCSLRREHMARTTFSISRRGEQTFVLFFFFTFLLFEKNAYAAVCVRHAQHNININVQTQTHSMQTPHTLNVCIFVVTVLLFLCSFAPYIFFRFVVKR